MKRGSVRVVTAPAPILSSLAPLPPNRVLSVALLPGEDVEWIWTSAPDGTRYVSGYAVIPAGGSS